ncbi:MAG: hypothetical protein HRU41_00505 [Saprospiraceae bacterium]|nr:hypothetical protein [Saprospiraceae bacterium]
MKINWRYAIGEVIIVIIGISIAFALNNWAESNQARKVEALYLKNLEKDLSNDLDSLNKNLYLLGQNLEDINQLRPHLGRQIPGRDTVFGKVFRVAETVAFIPEDATYHTLINSGDFKLISDFDLKSAIEKHYREYLHMQRAYDRRDNFSKNYMADFFVSLDYDAIYARKLDFMDDKRLRNMIFSLQGIIYLQIKAADNAKKSTEDLLASIQEKLQ